MFRVDNVSGVLIERVTDRGASSRAGSLCGDNDGEINRDHSFFSLSFSLHLFLSQLLIVGIARNLVLEISGMFFLPLSEINGKYTGAKMRRSRFGARLVNVCTLQQTRLFIFVIAA